MILPTIRASLSRSDAQQLVSLLSRTDPESAAAVRLRLEEFGIGSLLDDPRIRNALLTETDVSVPPPIIFYVLVRQALLEGGIDDENTSDYVASMLVSFGQAGRAYRVSDQGENEFHYLIDLIEEMRSADGRQRFLLRVHMGDFALWMSGLFPDYLEARTRRKGAPPISYFEQMGATGYLGASESVEAGKLGMDTVLRDVAFQFGAVRTALNRIADRQFWPGAGDPVSRLLREVSPY